MDREKRARAGELFAKGCTRAEVARQLGIPRATAGRWYRFWSGGGSLTDERRGRRPRLPPRARAQLNVVLHDSPRAHGFDLDRWSQDAVVALIEKRWGVRYHPRTVGRLLRRNGWMLPPVGATANAGVRSVPFADPDGTPLALLAWRTLLVLFALALPWRAEEIDGKSAIAADLRVHASTGSRPSTCRPWNS